MKLFIAIWASMIWALALAPMANASPRQSVTYTVTSTQPTRPTLVTYQHLGTDMYDSLNWGNGDNDTMPWRLTVGNVGTPRVTAQDYGKGHPLPLLACSIVVNGRVVAHSFGVSTVECTVGS